MSAAAESIWLRSVFAQTLRSYRIAILAWGVGLGMLPPLILAFVPALLEDASARSELLALARNPAVRLFADPVDVLTPGGYVTWRLSLLLPLMGVWALLAASRTVRGEEESGALDLLLSVPHSRIRVAVEKLSAIAAALLAMGSAVGLLTFAGARAAHAGVGLPRALAFGLNAALLAAVFGAIAWLASQFTRTRRGAAGFTGALLGLSLVMTGAARVEPGAAWIGRLSPLHYFEASKPLVESRGTDARAMLLLAAMGLAFTTAGLVLLARRDIGGAALIARSRAPRARAPLPLAALWLRSPFWRGLATVGPATAWWSAALAAYASALTTILAQAQDDLRKLVESFARRGPLYAELIAKFTGGSDEAFNARVFAGIFTILLAVFAGFAISLAGRWAADEEEGRLDLVLATPQARTQVMAARFGALVLALAAHSAAIFISVAGTARIVGFTLDEGRLAQAAFGMVPVGVVVAALGYLLAGWLRTAAATGTLLAVVVASFVVSLLGPFLKWPPLLMRLSVFEHYGTPLVDGLRPLATLGLLAAGAMLLGAAMLRFARKDLTR